MQAHFYPYTEQGLLYRTTTYPYEAQGLRHQSTMTITRKLLRILPLSLLNMTPSSMSLQTNSLQQPHQQASCPEYVGVFDPDVPSVHGSGPVVTIGSDIVYRDIYTWVEILSELADVHGTEHITLVIQPCLRSTAATWWTVELIGEEREKLRKADLQRWSSVLIERFELPWFDVLHKLARSRYTVQDLDQRPRIWIHQMLQDLKAYGEIESNQLSIIWFSMDQDLRKDIPVPNSDTKLIDFVEKVDEMYPKWVRRHPIRPLRSSIA